MRIDLTCGYPKTSLNELRNKYYPEKSLCTLCKSSLNLYHSYRTNIPNQSNKYTILYFEQVYYKCKCPAAIWVYSIREKGININTPEMFHKMKSRDFSKNSIYQIPQNQIKFIDNFLPKKNRKMLRLYAKIYQLSMCIQKIKMINTQADNYSLIEREKTGLNIEMSNLQQWSARKFWQSIKNDSIYIASSLIVSLTEKGKNNITIGTLNTKNPEITEFISEFEKGGKYNCIKTIRNKFFQHTDKKVEKIKIPKVKYINDNRNYEELIIRCYEKIIQSINKINEYQKIPLEFEPVTEFTKSDVYISFMSIFNILEFSYYNDDWNTPDTRYYKELSVTFS